MVERDLLAVLDLKSHLSMRDLFSWAAPARMVLTRSAGNSWLSQTGEFMSSVGSYQTLAFRRMNSLHALLALAKFQKASMNCWR